MEGLSIATVFYIFHRTSFSISRLVDCPFFSVAGNVPVQKNDLLSGSVSTGQGSHVGANSCHPHLILLALLVPELYRGQFFFLLARTLKWHCDTLWICIWLSLIILPRAYMPWCTEHISWGYNVFDMANKCFYSEIFWWFLLSNVALSSISVIAWNLGKSLYNL